MKLFVFRMSVIGLLLAGALFAACTQPTSAATAASFCGSPIVRDYEAPLRALPPASPVPRQLPFAPPSMEAGVFLGPDRVFRELLGKGLLYRGGAVGLSLSAKEGQVQLNWGVKIVVSRPAADGSSSEPVLEVATRVESVQKGYPARLIAGLLEELGTFRIDTTFLDEAGTSLGSYFEYMEVVPRTLQIRLTLSRPAIRPGGAVRFRLENLGTWDIGYSYPYSLERYVDHHWEPIPQGPFFVPLSHLSAGRASPCQSIRVPEDARPGLYRIGKNILFDREGKRVSRVLRKTFRVQGRRSAH